MLPKRLSVKFYAKNPQVAELPAFFREHLDAVVDVPGAFGIVPSLLLEQDHRTGARNDRIIQQCEIFGGNGQPGFLVLRRNCQRSP